MADLDAAEELAYRVIAHMRDLAGMDLAKGAVEVANTLRQAMRAQYVAGLERAVEACSEINTEDAGGYDGDREQDGAAKCRARIRELAEQAKGKA